MERHGDVRPWLTAQNMTFQEVSKHNLVQRSSCIVDTEKNAKYGRRVHYVQKCMILHALLTCTGKRYNNPEFSGIVLSLPVNLWVLFARSWPKHASRRLWRCRSLEHCTKPTYVHVHLFGTRLAQKKGQYACARPHRSLMRTCLLVERRTVIWKPWRFFELDPYRLLLGIGTARTDLDKRITTILFFRTE